MTVLERRYHVPRSQVWEGSRGAQRGNVHLYVMLQPFDHGRIHRQVGQTLCGKTAWWDRAPESEDELSDDALCPRCRELASRAGAL